MRICKLKYTDKETGIADLIAKGVFQEIEGEMLYADGIDAMVHDYDYLHGANRNFIKKWKADIKYIKNMERNGKGIRIFRLFLLTIIGIVFVPYCFIKYKIIK